MSSAEELVPKFVNTLRPLRLSSANGRFWGEWERTEAQSLLSHSYLLRVRKVGVEGAFEARTLDDE